MSDTAERDRLPTFRTMFATIVLPAKHVADLPK
jgi:hypothetical protein